MPRAPTWLNPALIVESCFRQLGTDSQVITFSFRTVIASTEIPTFRTAVCGNLPLHEGAGLDGFQ